MHADPARRARVARGGHAPARTARSFVGAARRGQERVPAVAAGVRLRAAVLPRPLRRAGARRCPCTAPATRPGCCSSCTTSASTPSPRLAAFCIVVGALSAPLTYVLGEARASTSDARADRRRAGRVLARAAALRRDLGRRRLPHARPARRDPAARAGARGSARSCSPSSRCSPGRCSPSARGRRSSSSPATAAGPRSGSPPLTASTLLAFHAAVRARHRLRPDRHAARHRAASTRSGSPRGARTRTGCSAPRPRSC